MRRFFCVFCVFCVFSSYLLALQNDSVTGGAATDQCAPVVTDQDLESLNQIAENPTAYVLPGTKFSKQDIRAMQHFIEESQTCGKRFIKQIQQMDSLLYVMDLRASSGGIFSPTDVLMVRQLELASSGLTPQETSSLGSCESQNLSDTDRLALHKYIDLAEQKNGLTGFPLFMRLQLFQIIIQNIGNGFSLRDVEILRRNTLRMMGLSDQEISTLHRLSKLPDGSRIGEGEALVLQKWIRIENVFPIYTLMDFEEFSSLHSLIQHQSDPPLPAQTVRNDQKAFQKALDQPVVILLSSKEMQILQEMMRQREDYIRGSLKIGKEQEKSLYTFLLAMGQFGRVPGFDAEQTGQLLEVIQSNEAFQDQENVRRVARIEWLKSGFTWEQKQALEFLVKNPQVSLSQDQVRLLKMYILKAKESGGLNGFSLQEKALLLSIIENNRNKYFTASDVTALRQAANPSLDNVTEPTELSKTEAQQINEAPKESMPEQMQEADRQQRNVPEMPQNPSFSPKGEIGAPRVP